MLRFLTHFLHLALAGCSLAPELVKPAAPIPGAYPDATPAVDDPAADVGWRSMFIDPRLQRLIELALEGNRDLRQSVLNVDIAYSQYGILRAAHLPGVDATIGAARQRGVADGASGVTEQQSATIGMNAFELDLFGRARSLSDAGFARYLASIEGLRAARLTLVTAVADAYVAQLFAAEQLALSERTEQDWRQSLSLTRRLHAAQQASGLDVAQAEGQAATAEADIEGRRRVLAQSRNALVLLIGVDLPTDLPPAMALADGPMLDRLPAGLPSDLLVRRPDILQAERNLAAANADIGAARAAFFPRLSLTGTLGYASAGLGKLFDSQHRSWTFAPQVVLPLFSHGRLRAELRVAELRKNLAVVEYERVIQVAFHEVADGLAGQATFGQQMAAQEAVVAASERRARLSELRYRAGMESRLELLDSQRQLYLARQGLLELRRSEFASAIAMYKAIGGDPGDGNQFQTLRTDVTPFGQLR